MIDNRVVCINFDSQFEKFIIFCFTENLALKNPAWQSSTARSYTGAERAVDGRYTNLSWYGGQCAASDIGHKIAEWRVDLGAVKYIHHVFIQHGTDNKVWGRSIVSIKLIHSI